MHLKRLTISGFKSFATRSELQFAPGITAVVGPNGSGKSNVADAIRWVLGEQSVKSLRGRRGHDLIFAGAEGRAKSSMAEVTLVIDNADRRDKNLPAEIALTRRIYRSGETEYLLGGKAVRLLDVVTLLAESGFGQSSYTVISQGMVDSLLIGTPAERKALFDEAVGVRPYYLKRDASVRRLRATQENLEQVRSVLRELTPTLGALERTVGRAAERATLETEFASLAADYYGARLGRLEAELGEKAGAERDSRREAERLEREIAKLTQTEAGERQVSPELEEAREALRRLTASREELARSLAVIQGRIQAAREHGGGLELRARLDRLSRLESEQKALATEAGERRKRLKHLSAEAQKAAAERDRLREKLDQLRAEIHELEQADQAPESAVLLSQARAVAGKLRGAKSDELSALIDEMDALLARLETALAPEDRSDLQALRARIREHDYALRQAETTAQSLAVEEASLTSLTLAAEERGGALEREVTSLRTETDSAQTGDTSDLDLLRGEEKQAEAALKALESQLASHAKAVEKHETELKRDFEARAERRTLVLEKQGVLRGLERELTTLQIETARIETRLEDLKAEIVRELGAPALTTLPRTRLTPDGIARSEAGLQRLRARLASTPELDPETTQEYQELRGRHEFLSGQSTDLEAAAGDLDRIVGELDQTIRRQFDQRFTQITSAFQASFTELFGGGRAEITLERTEDDEMGIEIRATPPGKKLSEIASLSGGERALTSVALLIAILTVNPSPFVVLDEIDAALDEANTAKFATAFAGLAQRTQFILITHNRRTMEQAGVLYGVTMDEGGVSRVISLKLEEAEAVAK